MEIDDEEEEYSFDFDESRVGSPNKSTSSIVTDTFSDDENDVSSKSKGSKTMDKLTMNIAKSLKSPKKAVSPRDKKPIVKGGMSTINTMKVSNTNKYNKSPEPHRIISSNKRTDSSSVQSNAKIIGETNFPSQPAQYPYQNTAHSAATQGTLDPIGNALASSQVSYDDY